MMMKTWPWVRAALTVAILLVGPWATWNILLVKLLELQEVNVWVALCVAFSLWIPYQLWKCIKLIPEGVEWIRVTTKDYRRKSDLRDKIKKLVAQGKTAEAVAVVQFLRQQMLAIRIEAAEKLADLDVEEIAKGLVS